MSASDSSNDIDIPCVGVCIVDDAGYCLGCGRPPAPVEDASGGQFAESSAQPRDQRRGTADALASALSTTLTQ